MFSKTGVDDPVVLICNKQRPNIKYYLFVSEGSEEIYTRNPLFWIENRCWQRESLELSRQCIIEWKCWLDHYGPVLKIKSSRVAASLPSALNINKRVINI